MLTGGGSNNGSGAGKIYTFESGSMFVSLVNQGTEGSASYVFDNATLYTPLYHSSWHDGQNMIRYITLRNGARTIGNPLRSGDCSTLTINSDGTGPNVFGTGMCLYSQGNPTLYITTLTDLEIPGNLYQAPGYASNTPVVKRGNAKLTLSGENSFGGRFTIEAGTVELASNTALPTSSPLTLTNTCTVTCGATTNSTGVLTLSGNATINVGDGALSFADSHDATWAADATLNIVGTGSLPGKAIRFGTNGSGLTAAQLKQIRYNGDKVSLTGQGYLGGPQGLIIMIL
jgi:autotransporter-associated beta strand protein